ncbi:MAG: SMC-Scp complex subunit ScpB [Eubacteriales bacterium]
MNRESQFATIEAVLFAVGESVSLARIAEVIQVEKEDTRILLEEMMEEYSQKSRGIMMIELDGSYQLCSKPHLYDALIQVVKSPKRQVLTDTVIETLSIIAYKQPVTRLEIEKIRGVSCDHAVNKLLEYDLIKELGRLNAPGKPLLFGTSENFLRTFGVTSIQDLPMPNEEQLESFKQEVEEEIKLQLPI